MCAGVGFVKGLGQGLVGAAAQPVSGALDLLSSAFEGIDASSNTILGRLSARPRAVARRRLPRALGGDRKLLPFVRSDGTDRQVGMHSLQNGSEDFPRKAPWHTFLLALPASGKKVNPLAEQPKVRELDAHL